MKRFMTTLAAFAVASAVAVPTAQAVPSGRDTSDHAPDYRIEVTGKALLEPTGYQSGTTIRVPIAVWCPLGERLQVPFAGIPGYFPDNAFAEPYLPGNTAPLIVTCTGQRQSAFTVARSVSRLQDPATTPFRFFTPGSRITVTVILTDQGTPLASDVERIRITG